MSLSATVRALVLAGATPEMILAVVEVWEQGQDPEGDYRREREAARQARRRALMPANWSELRERVFYRDQFVCTYCGEATTDPECDHIIPLSRGGSNDLDNLTTACRPCNSKKGARTPDEWRAL